MSKPLLGEKIAVLVSNGFSEKDLTSTQKSLLSAGANVRVVSMDNGLVNSWNETGWGLNFAADEALNEALAVDYSMLLVPGGQRSIDKLKLTAHTRRFVNGFLNANKPAVLLGEAVSLLTFCEKGEGMKVSSMSKYADELKEAGADVVEEPTAISGALLTSTGQADQSDKIAEEVINFFLAQSEPEAVAA